MVISENALLSQVQLGDLVLPNRCVMAPLTRCRAVDHLPSSSTDTFSSVPLSAALSTNVDAVITEK